MFSGRVSCLIKIAAVVFVAVGLSFSGFYFASVYGKKTEIIENIVMMLGIIKTQLRYAKLPLQPMMLFLEKNENIHSLGFVSECIKRIESGESFRLSWKESIKSEKELCRLIPDSLPYLIQFGESLGTTDLEGQLSSCEYYERIFLKLLEEKEEQSKKYAKLFPTLGIMLGVSAAILII